MEKQGGGAKACIAALPTDSLKLLGGGEIAGAECVFSLTSRPVDLLLAHQVTLPIGLVVSQNMRVSQTD